MEPSNPIIDLVVQYPELATVITVIGALRLVIKPLMSFGHEFVNITVTKKDNEWLRRLESSKGWKVFVYFLDWFGSIKLPKKPTLF